MYRTPVQYSIHYLCNVNNTPSSDSWGCFSLTKVKGKRGAFTERWDDIEDDAISVGRGIQKLPLTWQGYAHLDGKRTNLLRIFSPKISLGSWTSSLRRQLVFRHKFWDSRCNITVHKIDFAQYQDTQFNVGHSELFNSRTSLVASKTFCSKYRFILFMSKVIKQYASICGTCIDRILWTELCFLDLWECHFIPESV